MNIETMDVKIKTMNIKLIHREKKGEYLGILTDKKTGNYFNQLVFKTKNGFITNLDCNGINKDDDWHIPPNYLKQKQDRIWKNKQCVEIELRDYHYQFKDKKGVIFNRKEIYKNN